VVNVPYVVKEMSPIPNYALRSLNQVAFEPPMKPPSVPEYAAGATSAQITEDNRAHAHQRHDFNHHHNVKKNPAISTAHPTVVIHIVHDVTPTPSTAFEDGPS
jgi:hypothetical protein